MLHEANQEAVRNIGCKAGDVVIFMEATIHGSLPWNADWERRSLLYRYSPKFCSFSQGICETEMPAWYDELTEVQKAVLEPPYVYSRPLIEDDVETLVTPRNEPKDHIPRKRYEY